MQALAQALLTVVLDPELAPGLLQEQVQVQVMALSAEVLGPVPDPCLLQVQL